MLTRHVGAQGLLAIALSSVIAVGTVTSTSQDPPPLSPSSCYPQGEFRPQGQCTDGVWYERMLERYCCEDPPDQGEEWACWEEWLPDSAGWQRTNQPCDRVTCVQTGASGVVLDGGAGYMLDLFECDPVLIWTIEGVAEAGAFEPPPPEPGGEGEGGAGGRPQIRMDENREYGWLAHCHDGRLLRFMRIYRLPESHEPDLWHPSVDEHCRPQWYWFGDRCTAQEEFRPIVGAPPARLDFFGIDLQIRLHSGSMEFFQLRSDERVALDSIGADKCPCPRPGQP